jgi:alkylation response protein AidB-like acyl-CoA dehydrogenase
MRRGTGETRGGPGIKSRVHLRLSEDERAFQLELRTFFEAVPWALREAVATDGPLRREPLVETHRLLHEAGLAVPHWPVEWGGRDWSPMQLHLWDYEMHRAGLFGPMSTNTGLVGPVVAQFGSEELKRRFLPRIASLELFFCQGFSEPEAGSDLASVRTTAVLDGEEYVVNGQKTWTSLAHMADWIFALVRTDPDAPRKQQGISFLLIDLRSPGVTVRPIRMLNGESDVNEVFFDQVRVPADQLVGEPHQGWSYAKFLLGNERVGNAQIGHTKLRLSYAKRHAAEPLADGSRPVDDPAVRRRIAELENQLVALELTALRVTGGSVDGRPDPASSVLKVRGTQLQQAVSELIMDLAGPDSLATYAGGVSALPTWATRSVGTYLDLRKVSIYGGSNEIQRGIIASSILGL